MTGFYLLGGADVAIVFGLTVDFFAWRRGYYRGFARGVAWVHAADDAIEGDTAPDLAERNRAMSREVPEGYHLEWVPDPNWKLADRAQKCRHSRCLKPAVAVLDRGHRKLRWWYYCKDHLYGRKIEDGVVKVEILVKDEERSADAGF